MRMVMRSFRPSLWAAPLLVLIAIALISGALMVALIAAGLTVVFSVLRLFLPGRGPEASKTEFRRDEDSRRLADGSVIDADFEVKSGKENSHRQDAKKDI